MVSTLTVTDVHGNTDTCTSTATVQDNVDPDAPCKDLTAQLDGTGNASITGADIDNGSSDACGIASLVASADEHAQGALLTEQRASGRRSGGRCRLRSAGRLMEHAPCV